MGSKGLIGLVTYLVVGPAAVVGGGGGGSGDKTVTKIQSNINTSNINKHYYFKHYYFKQTSINNIFDYN